MRRVLISLLLVLATASVADAANRYDPRLRFRTLTTPRFDIYFHQGEDELARRLSRIVEEVATELQPRLGRPRARIHVILVNQTDLANGWATPLPYNLIEIVAASPRAQSEIGNTNDWLRLVFTHEYAHILHLERSGGFLGAVGRVFGRNPFFYPNMFLPPWQIEGLATHIESATGEGRVHAGDFRMVMTRAAAARRFPGLDRVSNTVVQWPGGTTPYLYGAYFHEYLAKTYGKESITRLIDGTASRVPLFGPLAYREVFGKPLGALWKDFEREVAAGAAAADLPGPRRLTSHGFSVGTPWFAPDGRLYYSRSDPHGFPALMELADERPRQVATRAGGEQLAASANEIVFDQVEYVRSVALQSDLYAYSPATGNVRRLTREARAADPDVSPDGTTIVCVVQGAEGRALATMAFPQAGAVAVPTIVLDEPGVDYASPRWSPDGRTIAVERRAVGGPSEIVIVERATSANQRLVATSPRGRNASPVWARDGRTLYFASDRDGGPFQLYAVDTQTSKARRLDGAGASAHSPAVSPDGKTLAFVGYTPAGYDLFSVLLEDARWQDVAEPSASATPSARPMRDSSAVAPIGETYSPLKTLLPRFWSPVIEEDGDDLAIGASTAGADALGRHGYVVSAAWSTRGRPDWFAAYAYDRWRPTLFADVSDDQDPFREGSLRVLELNVGAALPFRRLRRTQTVLGSFHTARETVDCLPCERPFTGEATRRALRGAWVLDNARGYGYSLGNEEGFSLGVSSEWTASALGADGNARAVVVDARGYQRAGPRHAVLAARVAAASAWGDDSVRRTFAAGGSSPADGVGLNFDSDAVALIRGFEAQDVFGDKAAVLNVDYRVPLKWIERGVGTWPLFLRSVHGAVFADGGAAWTGRRTRNDRRASAGLELSADLVVGYQLPLTATVGVAARHDPSGRSDGFAVFARVGRAF